MNNLLEKSYNKPFKYKEICEIMNDEYISTNNGSRERNEQIKKWKTDYEIHKEGSYYFIIRELTEDEKYILKNQKEATRIIQEVIIWYLYNQNKYKVYLTYNKLFEILHFVNEEYNKARFQTLNETLSKEFETTEQALSYKQYLDKFFYVSKDIMADMLNYVFKLLQADNAIIIKNHHFAFYDSESYIDESTQKVKRFWKTTICTDKEVSKILSIQNETMESYEVKPSQYYYCTNETKKEIKNKMEENVRKEFGHSKYSKVIEFLVSIEVVEKEYNNISLDFDIINKAVNEKLKKSKRIKDLTYLEEFLNKYQIEPINSYT